MGMKVNGTSGLTFPDTTTLASAGQASVRAWVNFNGQGTVAIRAAYNVSSITDIGNGQYQVNFTTAMPDANYATNISSNRAASWADGGLNVALFTTTSVFVNNVENNTSVDTPIMCVSIFR